MHELNVFAICMQIERFQLNLLWDETPAYATISASEETIDCFSQIIPPPVARNS
jgi:hypothetical protein